MTLRLVFVAPMVALTLAIPAFAAGTHGSSHSGTTAAATGQPGKAEDATRVIEVTMTDNAFSIPSLEVAEGETVRFVIRNEGEFLHEFNIATSDMHGKHQEEMMAMMAASDDMTAASMAGEHDDPNSILLDPGMSSEMIWKFGQAANLEFACNVPGHYQSGMVGPVSVGNGKS